MKNADLDLERSVLASMLLSPEVIPNINHEILEGDFYYPKNRDIFRALIKMADNKQELNLITLNAETGGKYPVDVATLTDVIPSGSNWQYYVLQVKRLSRMRDFSELIEKSKDVTTENIDTKLSEFSGVAAQIAESCGGQIKTARDFIIPMIDSISEAMTRKTEYSGYDTGLGSLNRIVDGLQKEYIIIGARASIGKSAIGLNIARSLVKNNIKTAIFSLEMSGKAMLMRVLSDVCNVQASALKNGLIRDSKAMTKINQVGIEMAEWPLYLIDDTRGEFSQIIAKTRYLVRCMGVQVVIIDHASLMKYSDRKLQRHEQYAEMSNSLQNLQRELNIPIVVMAQLGRDAEGKVPSIANLRESGAFEQDADQIWILHRDRAVDANQTSIETDLMVQKNRNGACGTAELYFQPQFIRFVDRFERKSEAGR